MDRNLLDALQNIGEQLEVLANVLSQKKESTSDIVNILTSGNFSEQLKTISVEIRSIKSNTDEILRKQDTILSISKERESKKIGIFEEGGKQEDNIKKGAVAIIGIAAAVLAVGTAFNLIDKVDIPSVLALSTALGVMAFSFEKISNSNLTISSVLLVSGLVVTMSLAILASSYILNRISVVSSEKLVSALGIAGMFSLVSLSIGKLVEGFKDIKAGDIIPITFGMLFIFPAISLGIALSSYALNLIAPIGLMQIFSAVLIAGLFVVLSFGIKNIVNGLKGIDPGQAIIVGLTAPILFVGLSFAIAGSSLALSNVQDISFSQFATSIGISILFVALSFAIKPLVTATRGIRPQDTVIIPIMFTALSIAISMSSGFLKDTEEIELSKIVSIVATGIALGVISTVMAIPIRLLSNIGPATILKGGLAIVGIAGVIATSSHLLSLGDYKEYPDASWSLGVGLSLAAFGTGMALLGALVFGPQALIFAAGAVAVIGVAGTIVAVSKILKEGDYDIPSMLDWAKSTSLLYATFAPIMVVLGGVGLASGVLQFFGANPWEKAKEMILGIASTIVEVSKKLQLGTYSGGPNKEWAEGISLALGAFSPIYEMLVKNKVASIFTSGDIGPKDFNNAINTIADGIISVSDKFQGTKFVGGPDADWSHGVGKAIIAFSPVYKMLLANKVASWFGGGIGPKDFNNAIKTVSEGIIETAGIFEKNTTSFTIGSYPTEEWGKGVGSALSAFSPIFQMLMEKSGFWKSGKDVVKDMIFGIVSISTSIAKTAKIFSGDGVNWNSYPDASWIDNVSHVVDKYVALITKLKENNDENFFDFFKKDPIVKIAESMIQLSKGYDKLASSLVNLSSSMKLMNVDNLKTLVVLNESLANPSLTLNTPTTEDKLQQLSNITLSPTNITKNNVNTGSIEDKLQKMIELLTVIQGNTVSLDQVMQLISEERIKNDDIV